MIRLALCDDESVQRATVGTLLQNYAAQRPDLAVKLTVFASGRELLAAVEESDSFDLYVLDIVMPELSGIDVGMQLRQLGSDAPIIYLTISSEYAVDSYSARAFHYLIKPVDPVQLYQVLDQAVAAQEKRRSACITVRTRGSVQLVRMDEILYAELTGRAVRYHLFNRPPLDGMTLRIPFQKEIAPLLADARFFLCGASFVANLFYVTAVEKNFLRLDGGARVPLARGLTALARRRWRDFWLGAPREATP